MSNCLPLPLILLGLLFNVPAVAAAASGAPSCAENPASRQLDFWLGNWSVDSGRGRSTVHLALDKCELVESWASNTSDHRGENTLSFDPEDNTWYGLFVDNRGRVHSFRGSAAPGALELHGPAHDESGAAVLKRVRVVRVSDATVEQVWEKSADQGRTWTLDFKMEYTRSNP